MAALLAWVTFPGGGVYPAVWIPAACAIVLLALAVRPQIGRTDRTRAVDLMLVLSGLAILMQLVPLPYSVLQAIDPNAVPLRTALWRISPTASLESLRVPVSIVPADTAAAFGIFAASALLFWTCRQVCEAGGTGRIVRAIAFIGLAASLAAIVQRAESQELLYGFWRPRDVGARPYGPFVNRNHFATWVIMACPLVFGYLLARAPAGRTRHLLSQRLVSALEQLGSIRIWLVTSVCLMTLAVLISTSRSGLIGLIGAFSVSAWLSRNRQEPTVRRWMIFQGALLVLVALSFANFDSLTDRLDETLISRQSNRGRRAVWGDAQRVIADFPLVGTGAGTFGTAVAVYQTAEPGYSIGDAHNHYLQLAAEGGVWVATPAAIALAMLIALFRRTLADDRGPDYLIRAGAISGIAAVLLQSFWETGLRMPANAMLLAVLTAIATQNVAAVRRSQ